MDELKNKLCRQIEISVGRKVQTPKDFSFLAECIWGRLHVQISPTTLRRVWGYQADEGPTRTSTLDILSRFCGYSDWDSFSRDSKKGLPQSAVIFNRSLYVEDLKVGCRLALNWAPDRSCEVKYHGEHCFEVLRAENAILKVGNTFKCDVFIEGEPLYIYDLVQGNAPGVCYFAGKRDGIRYELKEE